MTDLAGALATKKLTPFEGKDVLRAAIEMPGAAGGLREAMKFDPVELAHDEEGYVVLHWKVGKVRFDEIKDTDALSRVHVLIVDNAMLIDEQFVREQMEAQNEKIRKAKEAAAGVADLGIGTGTKASTAGDTDDEDEERRVLQTQHDAGAHSEGPPREGCPKCEEEIAAYAAEQGGGNGIPTGNGAHVVDKAEAATKTPAKAATKPRKAAAAKKAASPADPGDPPSTGRSGKRGGLAAVPDAGS